MKKLLILALVALVAGSAFATTDPAFTGDFEFNTQIDFDDEAYIVGASPDASINLNGIVDEWSTVNAEIGTASIDVVTAAEVILDMSNPGVAQAAGNTISTTYQFITVAAGDDYIGNTYDVGDELVAASTATTAGLWQVSTFVLTTDITGALGVDGPLGVTVTWGAQSFQAADYSGKAGYGEIEVPVESGTYICAKFDFIIAEKVTIIAALVPQSYMPDAWTGAVEKAVLFFEAQFAGLVEGLDANVWFLSDQNTAAPQIGLTVGYGSDMFDLGAAFSYVLNEDPTDDVIAMGISGAYKMDILTAGLAFKVSDFGDFTGTSAVGVNLTWLAVPDMLDVFVAASIPFADFDTGLGFEGGVVFALGATDYTIGYEYNTVNFKAPDNEGNDGMFFMVNASF